MHSSPDWKIKPKKYKLKSPKWQRNRRTQGIISFVQMKADSLSRRSFGLMFIDQKQAHERVLYERYLETLSHQQICGQKAFPKL
ncbi:MAG: hypothetical protein ACLU4N_06970 [Butyricimonas faecihominis]